MAITWVDGQEDVEDRDVLNALRPILQAHGGMAWLSRRTFSRKVLRRGDSRSLDIAARLVRRGELCRVSAPGRGRGRGRTLYWLPATPRLRVLRELEAEGMPLSAIHAAERFFLRPKNGAQEHRQQSPRGTEQTKKDARLPRAVLTPFPTGPPGPQPMPAKTPGTPRIYGPLTKHAEAMRRFRAQQNALRQLHE